MSRYIAGVVENLPRKECVAAACESFDKQIAELRFVQNTKENKGSLVITAVSPKYVSERSYARNSWYFEIDFDTNKVRYDEDIETMSAYAPLQELRKRVFDYFQTYQALLILQSQGYSLEGLVYDEQQKQHTLSMCLETAV